MVRAKNYVFFVDLPIMQNRFYFHAEEVEMKKPLIAGQNLDENKILYVNMQNPKVYIKDYNNQSAQFILENIKKYEYYEGYDGEEDHFFYHYHNLLEISIVLSGEGYYFVDGKAIRVQKGSVIIFNPLVPHAWLADKDNPPIQKTFIFYPTLLIGDEIEKEENQVFREYLHHMTYLYIDKKESARYEELLESIYKEYIERKEGYQLTIKSLLLLFFVYIFRERINVQERKPKSSNYLDIEQAIKYMKNNFHNNISLEEVASKVYMHPNYFSTVFKKKCGISFAEYMNSLKVSMATELMQSTDLTIDEIAIKCGFSSLSNFYRVFKKIYKVSPAKYSKQIL
nr:AraC family transcriptional regulator [uncultured Niameybacter sp.]